MIIKNNKCLWCDSKLFRQSLNYWGCLNHHSITYLVSNAPLFEKDFDKNISIIFIHHDNNKKIMYVIDFDNNKIECWVESTVNDKIQRYTLYRNIDNSFFETSYEDLIIKLDILNTFR